MAPGDYGLLAGVCPLQGVLPFRYAASLMPACPAPCMCVCILVTDCARRLSVIASFHTTDPGFDLSQAEALVAGLPTELFGRLFAVKGACCASGPGGSPCVPCGCVGRLTDCLCLAVERACVHTNAYAHA